MTATIHPLQQGVRQEDWDDWRWQTRHRVRSLQSLRGALGLGHGGGGAIEPELLERFPVGVTPYYLSLADPSDPADPILAQVLPSAAEGAAHGQEVADPFREQDLAPVPGVIHRYGDRALIVPTNFCATLCRHCFRKRSWGDGFFTLGRAELAAAVDYVRRTTAIRDVLVTGGDPLHLPFHLLGRLLQDLRGVEHLEVLRVASRVPVTLPQRIDGAMLDLLASVRPLWFITHFNHVREVSRAAAAALRQLLDRGITVQNQTVLLRGVNDSTDAQLELSRALLSVGVRPYYLHVADPVAGAGHFRVSVDRAVEIVRGMVGRIAGFGVPRLVLDLPGGKGKVPLSPDFEVVREGRTIWFQSPIDGSLARFEDPPA